MASILLVTASPYGTSSRGTDFAAQAVANLLVRDPSLRLVERDLTKLPQPVLPQSYAEAIVTRQPHDAEAFALSEQLIREVEDASFVIIATPMHNYTVPASLKLWIDLVLRFGRTFAPVNGVKTGLLEDRPTLIVVTAGGLVTGPNANQPDHLTGYMTDVLATIGIRALRFQYLEATVNAQLAEQAQSRSEQDIARDTDFGYLQIA